jgi:hypothetical protein
LLVAAQGDLPQEKLNPANNSQQQQNIKTRDQCMDAAAGSYSQTISQLDGNPALERDENAIERWQQKGWPRIEPQSKTVKRARSS